MTILTIDVQKKAQEEIDSVIGSDRLPTFADLSQLPYVNAVVTEVLRWNSVAPVGVPHRATEDGIISGYFIPKDSIVMCNLWCVPHLLNTATVSSLLRGKCLQEHVARREHLA